MAANSIKPIAMTSKDSSALTGGYDVVNTGLTDPCFILRIVNDSNKDITISYDGVSPHDYLIAGTDIMIHTHQQREFNNVSFRRGQPVYVKGAVGTGFIYVVGYYSE